MNRLEIGIFCLFLTNITAAELTLTFNAEPLKKTSNARLNKLQDTYTQLETNAQNIYQNIKRIKEAAEPAAIWQNELNSLHYQIKMLQKDVNERLESLKKSSLNKDELFNAYWLAENTDTLLETIQLIIKAPQTTPSQYAVHQPQHYQAVAIDVMPALNNLIKHYDERLDIVIDAQTNNTALRTAMFQIHDQLRELALAAFIKNELSPVVVTGFTLLNNELAIFQEYISGYSHTRPSKISQLSAPEITSPTSTQWGTPVPQYYSDNGNTIAEQLNQEIADYDRLRTAFNRLISNQRKGFAGSYSVARKDLLHSLQDLRTRTSGLALHAIVNKELDTSIVNTLQDLGQVFQLTAEALETAEPKELPAIPSIQIAVSPRSTTQSSRSSLENSF